MKLKLGLPGTFGTSKDEAILIQTIFKEKTRSTMLAKLTLAVVTWHIWKERNFRIFQLKESHKFMVFRRLYEDIRELLRTCTWKVDRPVAKKQILSNWNV